MKALLLTNTGPPSVLKSALTTTLPIPLTSPTTPFLIRMKYASVNFLDTYYRSGLYKIDLPAIIGSDGAGVIEKIHEGFESGFAVGDTVAVFQRDTYGGTYAEFVAASDQQIVKVPQGVPLPVACALIISGTAAHYLTRSTFPLTDKSTCLIQAVAGSTGQLIAQIAKNVCHATVIGTCSTAKVDFVKEKLSSCVDHLIDYKKDADFDVRVRELTENRGVNVVYDGVGRATFMKSLNSIARRGTMVSFGNASGPVEPFSPLELTSRGSLYLTRPSNTDYIAEPGELAARVGELYQWYKEGKISVEIQKHYKLEDAWEAHEDLESRKSHGKFIVDIDG